MKGTFLAQEQMQKFHIASSRSISHVATVIDNRAGLTTVGLLHPGESDPTQVALTEAQQECPRLLVLQTGPLCLLTDKAHDAAEGSTSKPHHQLHYAETPTNVMF